MHKMERIAKKKRIGLLFSAVPNGGQNVTFENGDITQMFYTEHFSENEFSIITAPEIDPNSGVHKHTFQMVGSCNGLVCLYVLHDQVRDPIYIINPSTGQQLILPQIERHSNYFPGQER